MEQPISAMNSPISLCVIIIWDCSLGALPPTAFNAVTRNVYSVSGCKSMAVYVVDMWVVDNVSHVSVGTTYSSTTQLVIGVPPSLEGACHVIEMEDLVMSVAVGLLGEPGQSRLDGKQCCVCQNLGFVGCKGLCLKPPTDKYHASQFKLGTVFQTLYKC